MTNAEGPAQPERCWQMLDAALCHRKQETDSEYEETNNTKILSANSDAASQLRRYSVASNSATSRIAGAAASQQARNHVGNCHRGCEAGRLDAKQIDQAFDAVVCCALQHTAHRQITAAVGCYLPPNLSCA